MAESTVKRSPRGKGPKNSYGFRHGTKAALVSDLLAAKPMSASSLKGALEREFGAMTDDQFRSIVDFVSTKLRKGGHIVGQERVLFLSVDGKVTLAEFGM
jgi:hypothetical protein